MNLKRIFGALLTILGIAGLIYASISFVNATSFSSREIKGPIIYGVIGFLFFLSGINLIRTTKDEA
jgi:uncharacterized membrane protein